MYKVRQKGTTRLLTSIATTRRVALLVGALFSVFGSSWALATNVNQDNQPGESSPILQSIIDEAKQSAEQSYKENDHGLDDKLKDIDYQTYRAIRFKPEQSLWHGENDYEVQFFHPGFLYQLPVTVNVIDADNDATTVTATITGGTDEDWDNGDNYTITNLLDFIIIAISKLFLQS